MNRVVQVDVPSINSFLKRVTLAYEDSGDPFSSTERKVVEWLKEYPSHKNRARVEETALEVLVHLGYSRKEMEGKNAVIEIWKHISSTIVRNPESAYRLLDLSPCSKLRVLYYYLSFFVIVCSLIFYVYFIVFLDSKELSHDLTFDETGWKCIFFVFFNFFALFFMLHCTPSYRDFRIECLGLGPSVKEVFDFLKGSLIKEGMSLSRAYENRVVQVDVPSDSSLKR